MSPPRIALFSHYRRHPPLQLAALAAMILLATALWTGIHHLTSQARASLEQSESAVAERQQVVREDGQPVSVQDFVTLRRQGLCVMPWQEVLVPGGRGRLVGIDPLAAHCFAEPEHTPAPWQGELDGKPFVDISEAAAQASAEASAWFCWCRKPTVRRHHRRATAIRHSPLRRTRQSWVTVFCSTWMRSECWSC